MQDTECVLGKLGVRWSVHVRGVVLPASYLEHQHCDGNAHEHPGSQQQSDHADDVARCDLRLRLV